MAEPSGPEARDANEEEILHASCVAHKGRAVLILGRSGSGKSALALELMALGAKLVADDRTVVSRQGETLVASAPGNIQGLIEARGVGILRADAAGPTPVALAIDMETAEPARLPKAQDTEILGQSVPLLGVVSAPHFPSAILQMLACGRHSP